MELKLEVGGASCWFKVQFDVLCQVCQPSMDQYGMALVHTDEILCCAGPWHRWNRVKGIV